jgi:polysaccharide pyruvyl transferase WcaK-like protein
MGVAALAYSALALINDVLKEKGIADYEITFIGSSRTEKDSLIIYGETIEFNNIRGFNFLGWKAVVKLLLFPKKHKTKELLGFDYLFDIAEGDSFTDIYGDERFNRILNSKIFFNFLGKNQVLLPQTIGPFTKEKHQKKAFDVMKKLNAVMSRDEQSYDYTAKYLSKEKISETIDVAFYLPFQSNSFDENKINVGINVSGLLWNGGYTRDNQFNLKTDYKALIINLVEYFSSIENVQVHLVSHVVPGDGQAVEDDYFAAEELSVKFPNVIIPTRFSTPVEAKSYISGLDFFTGARMHACIAAFSSGVPVCPMAYSRKFNGLFMRTLKYHWMGDCVNDTEEIVFKNIVDAFERRNKLKEQIDNTLEILVKPRLEILKSIISNNINF